MSLRIAGRMVKQLDSGAIEHVPFITHNMCVGGFYAVCDEEFARGQRLECVLEVAAGAPSMPAVLYLHCAVRILRVEYSNARPWQFGFAVEIEKYYVERNESVTPAQ